MNVTGLVSDRGFCSGCGLCAAFCPEGILSMEFDGTGELRPRERDGCTTCGLCLECCPFSDRGGSIDERAADIFANLPGVRKTPVVGHHLSCREGYIEKGYYRQHGASGGVASWFLTRLLERGDVDSVLLAGPDQENPGFWTFHRVGDPERVGGFAGSVYHALPVTDALLEILSEGLEDRCAIIALPCLAYGLRKAAAFLPDLRERLKVLASLACGMVPTHRYEEYASLESGIPPGELLRMDFRHPPEDDDSGNYSHVAVGRDGRRGNTVPFRGLPEFLWSHGGCVQGGCLACDDVFGETADIVFMDAWLPEYEKERRGTSVVVSRHPLAEQILDEGLECGDCAFMTISPDRVKASQEETILIKRTLLAGRLARMEAEGRVPPRRRVKPDPSIAQKYRDFFDLCEEVRRTVAGTRLETFEDLELLRKKTAPLLEREKILRLGRKSPFTGD